jgi:hypothetical protein
VNEAIVLDEEVSEPRDELTDEDVEDLLLDALAFVEQTIGRGLPMYLKPAAYDLMERLQRSTGYVTLH